MRTTRSIVMFVLLIWSAGCAATEGGLESGSGGSGGGPDESEIPTSCVDFEAATRPPCGGDPTGSWEGLRCSRHLEPYDLFFSYCDLTGSASCTTAGSSSLTLGPDGRGTYGFEYTVTCTEIIPRACLRPGREQEFCESWSAEDVEVGPNVVSGWVRCRLEDDCICETETLMEYPAEQIRYSIEGSSLVVESWSGPVEFCADDHLLTLDVTSPGVVVGYQWLVRMR